MSQSVKYYFGAQPRRQGQWLFKLAVLVSLILAAVHVVLGSSVIVAFTAFFIILFGVIVVARFGVLNVAGLLLFLAVFRYVGFPVVGKLMVGQPLDTYLEQPTGSFLVVLLGMLGYIAALTVAAKIRVGRPLLKPVVDSGRLRWISLVAGVIGIVANFAVAFRVSEDYEGITTANFFVAFLHLSLIAAVASVLIRTRGKRSLDWWVIAVIISEFTFAMVQNSRMTVMDTFLSYIVTVAAFNARVSGRQLAGIGVAVVVVVLITPIMLSVRDVRSELSWTQRIETTFNVVRNWRDAITAYEAWRDLSSAKNYLQYYGAPQNVLERMSLVNHVDVLKSGVDRTRQVGIEDLGLAIEKVLPRVLSPEKPRGYSQSSWLYCETGVYCSEAGFDTAPLVAHGYASFGWVGVVVYPLLLGFPVLLLLKKSAGWNLSGNIWAVYLLLRVHNNFVEGGSDAYLIMLLRELPQDLLLLLLISASVGVSALAMRGKRSQGSSPDGA